MLLLLVSYLSVHTEMIIQFNLTGVLAKLIKKICSLFFMSEYCYYYVFGLLTVFFSICPKFIECLLILVLKISKTCF